MTAIRRLFVSLLLTAPTAAAGQSSLPNDPAVPAGHSMHGEAFNEGPRQRAELLKGMGAVTFPVTTRNPLAQAFFNQGVAQLHGFWYFEAERSFRQAALLDPDCAMAYWGMAGANTQNSKRARGLIKEAVARKSKSSPREQQWIEALHRFYSEEKRDEKTRKKEYAADLEAIGKQNPDDIEAKAFYALQLWQNSIDDKETRERAEKALNEVLAVNPMHPCHHYRIHLWNYNKDENALNSAARAGQSAPGIAHLWHMPGHTYSQLRQYDQAAWQQEASARVDHAHMMRYNILPDQIHNYAHNNEWLIRNLSFLGRARDALDLAKNMIELPRHPVYNNLEKWGSARYGRHRLIETLIRYEMWEEALRLGDSRYLEATERPDLQAERLHLLGLAHLNTGDLVRGRAAIADLETLVSDLESRQKNSANRAEDDARRAGKPEADVKKSRDSAGGGLKSDIEKAGKLLAELSAYRSLAEGDLEAAGKLFSKVSGIPRERLSRVELALGRREEAEREARRAASDARNEVQPLANLVYVLQQCGKRGEAEDKLKELRKLAAQADLDTAVMQRVRPVAAGLNLPADWRLSPELRTDVGDRPSLDQLGPFRWEPVPAAAWSLKDAKGRRVSLKDYRGKPVLVIFFLGSGCAHCLTQLNLFAPAQQRFRAAGIQMVAISSDNPEGLRKTLTAAEKPAQFPFPILSNANLDAFKSARCYDDFEKTPLHGTFLVDGKGLVRWHDIGYQPFTEIDFLLAESRRLLSQELSTAKRRSAEVRPNVDGVPPRFDRAF